MGKSILSTATLPLEHEYNLKELLSVPMLQFSMMRF